MTDFIGAQAMTVFVLANIAIALLLQYFSINLFGRRLTIFEGIISTIIVFLAPNYGTFWLVMDLFSMPGLGKFRDYYRPEIFYTALIVSVSWHFFIGFLFQRGKNGGRPLWPYCKRND